MGGHPRTWNLTFNEHAVVRVPGMGTCVHTSFLTITPSNPEAHSDWDIRYRRGEAGDEAVRCECRQKADHESLEQENLTFKEILPSHSFKAYFDVCISFGFVQLI